MTWNTTAQFRALNVVNNFTNFEIKKIGGHNGGRPQSYDKEDYSKRY